MDDPQKPANPQDAAQNQTDSKPVEQTQSDASQAAQPAIQPVVEPVTPVTQPVVEPVQPAAQPSVQPSVQSSVAPQPTEPVVQPAPAPTPTPAPAQAVGSAVQPEPVQPAAPATEVQPATAAAPAPAEQPQTPASQPTEPSTPPAAKIKGPDGRPQVLLAEDENDARMIYMDILKGQTFDVDAAANGKETLQKLEQKVYDLVLLDIIMPDMDGISVLTQIKNFPAKYGTPKVVMLTNIGGDLAIEKALDIGANGYMLKSETEPDELVRIIGKYLAGEDHVKLEKTIMDA